jgi:hypothetical protein
MVDPMQILLIVADPAVVAADIGTVTLRVDLAQPVKVIMAVAVGHGRVPQWAVEVVAAL